MVDALPTSASPHYNKGSGAADSITRQEGKLNSISPPQSYYERRENMGAKKTAFNFTDALRDDSFKAGMQVVVEWIKKGDMTRPVRWGWDMPCKKQTITIKMDAFLNKLKEWGLE